ncbi:MAG: aspartate/glutamate racemase family protein [Acidobacteriota bacterium]
MTGRVQRRDRATGPTSPPRWKKVIGIIGGLGPHAHLEFERLLLVATERLLGRAARDQDYPPWIVSSLPSTPDRTTALLSGGPSPLDALELSARRLMGGEDSLGADFAVIPCNTAHAFLEALRQRIALPILDMVRETAQEAERLLGGAGTVGILATTGTLESGLYSAALKSAGSKLCVLSPLDLLEGKELQEKLVMEPIYGPMLESPGGVERAGGGIKSGTFHDSREAERLVEPLRHAVKLLAKAGADLVITACTEIPLALGRKPIEGIPLLDPLDVAARASVDIAIGRRAARLD